MLLQQKWSYGPIKYSNSRKDVHSCIHQDKELQDVVNSITSLSNRVETWEHPLLTHCQPYSSFSTQVTDI